jgi:hypothetical protein
MPASRIRSTRRSTSVLVELHVRDAVHQQPADAIGTLVHGDFVAGLVQLVGGRQAGGARTDDGHALAGALRRRLGLTQPSSKPRSMIAFSMFLIVTGGSVMPSTQAPSQGAGQVRAGELREVVGLVQPVQGFAPAALVDEVVPLRNQVVDRATVVRLAERHATIHAAGALALEGSSSGGV